MLVFPVGVAASSLPQTQGAPCLGLTLVLQPRAHYSGAPNFTPPADLPPGALPLSLPLYPGAVPTTQAEAMPTFGAPAVLYLKSATSTVDVSASSDVVSAWYQSAFGGCGYTL